MQNFKPENTDNPLQLFCSANHKVNFCVWVLEWDGIQVPPFNFHSTGNRLLRDVGLDAEAWYLWCAKVVATQDQRLGGTKDPQIQQMLIQEQLASFEVLASLSKCKLDMSAIRKSLEKSMDWQAYQYEDAVNRLGSLSREASPPDAWSGEPKIGQKLREAWQEYLMSLEEVSDDEYMQAQQLEEANQFWRSFLKIGKRMIGQDFDSGLNKLYRNLQHYRSNLPVLQVYQVNYPTPANYIVPPVSMILSVANGKTGSRNFSKSVMRGAQELAKSGQCLDK